MAYINGRRITDMFVCLQGYAPTPAAASGVAVRLDDVYKSGQELDVAVSSKNLINTAMIYAGYTQTVNGVTAKANNDGSIVLNGTCTGGTEILSISCNIAIAKPGNHTLSCHYKSGSFTGNAFYFNISDGNSNYPVIFAENGITNNTAVSIEKITRLFLIVSGGCVFDNYTFNVQLERGTKATEYAYNAAYYPNFTITQYGRNLTSTVFTNKDVIGDGKTNYIDNSKDTATIKVDEYTPGVQYTVSLNVVCGDDITTTSTKPTDRLMNAIVTYTDGSSELKDIVNVEKECGFKSFTTAAGKSVKSIDLRKQARWTGGTITISDIQVECGDTATEYQPYISPVSYTPNENGTVDGVLSLSPTTTLISNGGVLFIDAEYQTKGETLTTTEAKAKIYMR